MTLLIFPIKKQQRQERQHSVFLMNHTFIFEYLLLEQKMHNYEIVLMLKKIKHSINLLKHNIECNFLNFNVNHTLFYNTFFFFFFSFFFFFFFFFLSSSLLLSPPQRGRSVRTSATPSAVAFPATRWSRRAVCPQVRPGVRRHVPAVWRGAC